MKHQGETIRKALKDSDLKANDLAKHLNISPQSLQSLFKTDNISFRNE